MLTSTLSTPCTRQQHSSSTCCNTAHAFAPKVKPCTALRSQRSHRSGAPCALPESSSQQIDAVFLDIDAIVHGQAAITTAWAFAAASSAAAEIAATPAGVYNRHMQQLLPVLREPFEAAFMLRLLHEEGIVGARSTAGREGPVVGRAVRLSGSRPLLLNEILEHWAEEILPTCLLRWSRQAGCSSSELEGQAREAYEQALTSVAWEVLDVQQQLHGSSPCPPQSMPAAAAVASPGRSSDKQQSTSSSGSSSWLQQATSAASVQCATASEVAVPAATAAASSTVSMVVQPYVSVVPCLQACTAQVFVGSTYPKALTQAFLSAAQLTCMQRPLQVLHGSSMQQCFQQLQQRLNTLQPEQGLYSSSNMPHTAYAVVSGNRGSGGNISSCTTSSNSNARDHSRHRQLLVVSSSPCRVTKPSLLQMPSLQEDSAPPSPNPAAAAAAAPASQDQALQPTGSAQPSLWACEDIQVAEWACRAPSLRARALSRKGLGLLSEWGLAEMLAVDSSDAVMDGIAWRQ